MDFILPQYDDPCSYATAIFRKVDGKNVVCCKKHAEQYLIREEENKLRKQRSDRMRYFDER